ncbi:MULTISPECIES: cobalamin biosynthesis protein CobW [unclassified Halomonas]|uniref:cobalamin biosynthesis protein CobW n=1 Tax=unclassified Halomonas TaxID=2609666 RepID=UPI00209D8742|nr:MULTISPECIES: cobalamin biosynthesis protein CobW [unclassified Halomonas]MCP1315361.1 cobalamin biosynthesis protein CobW [Halomonas sp. 707D7]MCP1327424.1 cobalamin biosynthesis protein CobW [Halomonas sp. 707D4]
MQPGNVQLSKIPATVVTGFLGSGKTTLLAGILRQMTGKRIAVIVNEFGEQDIDSSLLRSCALACEEGEAASDDDGIFELANGCICCTVEEEFLPVMKKLVARRERIDHILIETSGLALPKPLVQAFNWPEVRRHCTVDAIITMIDGPAVAAGRFAHDEARVAAQRLLDESLDHDPSLQELLDDQLSAADLVLVSKTDLLSIDDKRRVEAVVAAKVPASVKTLFVDAGLADDVARLEALMVIGAASEEGIDAIANHHDKHHAEGAHHDHAHDHFDACVVTLGEVDVKALESALQTILDTQHLYRAKGFAAVPGKPMRRVVQAVGKRLEGYFDRLWVAEEPRQTQLVFIGRHLDRDALREALSHAEVAPA